MSEQLKIVNFMGYRKVAAVLSIILFIASVASLATKQMNFGLDFTGGTQVEVGYSVPVDTDVIRDQLQSSGYEGAVVAHFGSDKEIVVRLQTGFSDTLGQELIATLQESTDAEISLRRVEFVGPQVGGELRDDGGLGMLLALLVVMVYVALRFQLKFAVGAVVALIHDVVLILGLFSFFQWEFNLTVLAALLAVIGYSLNDTIVVSDRIRENFRKLRKGDVEEIINTSLSQTLGRTVITSLTTTLVLMALFLLGGELIHNFALALLVGVLVGTYSSIYVAANVLVAMNITKEDLMPPEPEEGEAEFEEAP